MDVKLRCCQSLSLSLSHRSCEAEAGTCSRASPPHGWRAALLCVAAALRPGSGVQMQFTDTCVSTKDLTKSFGWDTVESFMQHDIQELNRVLTDKLDEKMKASVALQLTMLLPAPGMLCSTVIQSTALQGAPVGVMHSCRKSEKVRKHGVLQHCAMLLI